jgi:hypothetical protein
MHFLIRSAVEYFGKKLAEGPEASGLSAAAYNLLRPALNTRLAQFIVVRDNRIRILRHLMTSISLEEITNVCAL